MKYTVFFIFLISVAFAAAKKEDAYHIKDVQSLERVEELARNGDITACVRTAEFYLFGPYNLQDTQKALVYLRKAYQRYNLEAIEIMAGVYLNGRGIDKDTKMAERLYLVGAQAGNGPCQFNLGILYKNGDPDVPQNFEKAYFWLHKAATNPSLGPLMVDAATYRNEIALHIDPKVREKMIDEVRYENHRDGVEVPEGVTD